MRYIASIVRGLGFITITLSIQFANADNSSSSHFTKDKNETKPEHQIEFVMKSQFERPDAALRVNPVAIEGNYAVAGWFQKEKGGRALLQLDHGKWTIIVCGGDGLRDHKVLAQTGMNIGIAKRLAEKIQTAESKLSKEELKQLSLFEGMMKIESGQQHGSSHEHKSH